MAAPDDLVERFNAAVAREVTARNAVIEEACEQALQGGVCGVLILTRMGTPVRVGPHPDVPYGEIHYRPEET